MPIYEYKCLQCGEISEIFVRGLEGESVDCPMCGSHRLDKLLSASYTLKTDVSAPGKTCCGRAERCQTPPCSSDNTCRRDSK